MALIPWRGKHKDSGQGELAPLAALRNEMDRLFDSFLREPWGGWDWPFGGQQTWAPAVDVAETDEEVLVRAEIAGMEPKDLNISLTGNQLVLSGEKKESTETKEQGFFHTESRWGTFRRSVPLPGNVDPEKVEAEYSNGVVTIHVKKLQTTPPKRIEVKVR